MDRGQMVRHMNDDVERGHAEYIFDKQETGTLHNPYDQEMREFTSIENGDVDTLRKSLEEDYTGKIGALADNPLRSMKNRGIVVITLASRAAIRGGILPEISYSFADICIQKIETCRDEDSILELFHNAEYQYAEMVCQIRKNADRKKAAAAGSSEKKPSDFYLERCKTYIFAHLHEKISVRKMAGVVGLSADYLSDLFHRREGITITAYIQKEKIRLAKNLLVYSGYTYGEISAYLGFSSQSHLGRQFKSLTGMTMRQYRLQYGKMYQLDIKY